MKKNFFLCILLGILFSACSTKNDEGLYNLSANEWYKQIIKDLQDKDLEKADDHYNGMASEHIADPLLETTQIILAQAHMDEEEYQLAEFYLDEYNKKFGNSRNADYIRYLKIKAKFDAFAVPNRNQALMLESQKEIDSFLNDYPYTEYEPLVQTMLTKFNLAVFYLNDTIQIYMSVRVILKVLKFTKKDCKKVSFINKALSSQNFLGIEVYLKNFRFKGN